MWGCQTFEHSKLKIGECLNVKNQHAFMPYELAILADYRLKMCKSICSKHKMLGILYVVPTLNWYTNAENMTSMVQPSR